MIDTVIKKTYPEPETDIGEILRYMGCAEKTDDTLALLGECLEIARPHLTYNLCYREFPVSFDNQITDLSFCRTKSNALLKNLAGCKSILLFAATVGIGLDRLINRYSEISIAKAVCLQAIGSERVESLCNTFNNELKESLAAKGLQTKPRFSPGYGDLPLGIQTDIARVLDIGRSIGVSLGENLMMSPSKSVTAIIGITDSKSKNKS